MSDLAAEEMPHAADHRPLVGEHLIECPHHAVGAEDPDEVEAAQRIERSDAHPRCRRGFHETLGLNLQHRMRRPIRVPRPRPRRRRDRTRCMMPKNRRRALTYVNGRTFNAWPRARLRRYRSAPSHAYGVWGPQREPGCAFKVLISGKPEMVAHGRH